MLDKEVIVAIISVSGVLITAGITLVGYIWSKRQNKKVIFNQTVSEKRNIWLNEMRQYISEMLALANMAQNSYKPLEYYIARNQVVLRLNERETLHLMLHNQIKILDVCTSTNYLAIRDKVIELSKIILKEEWEKVKSEAKGEE
ncbi:MAG TPA: hypothetical protein H9892_04505 [Candidatus Protoclostridium stercorigallinarum]|uniref:Uncharacterized protein n=1 Tax=Candidatus Protoclostridium stercorigallinarum TaxID=2838741 RepID=A0A9D1Q0Z5_9FIRM|nr:hypothetical protein [Candidatus Protoclostridium stercorigallinarum]